MKLTTNLKTACFSALLVLAVAYPVLGLKLTTVGIKLEVHGASPAVLWTIAGAAIAMFFWQLFREQLSAAWASTPEIPRVPSSASNFMTLPNTQRWIIFGLILLALVWPFFGSRGAVDIATLILIYVMLGLGLNIVVGLAGLLDLGYVGFYAVGAYSYAILAHYFGLGFGLCLPLAGMMAALFGTLMAYSLARYNTGGQHLSFWVLSQRFLPPIAIVLPVFLIYRGIGIYDTHLGLILAYTVFTLPQLKILQEVITLTVFVPFAIFYMKAELKWDFLWAGLCLMAAVYFMFRSA